MTTLIGLSGSLRADSFNTALVRAAVELVPGGAQLIPKTIHRIPLYDGDLEAASGIPAAVRDLGDAIATPMACCWPRRNTTTPFPAPSKTPSTGSPASRKALGHFHRQTRRHNRLARRRTLQH